MTAKRFDWDVNGIWDYQSDSDEYLESSKEICELLNELHEENQILRHELLCKQLDKAPTEPINCKCHYEVKE